MFTFIKNIALIFHRSQKSQKRAEITSNSEALREIFKYKYIFCTIKILTNLKNITLIFLRIFQTSKAYQN
jgi:hypothetical protein